MNSTIKTDKQQPVFDRHSSRREILSHFDKFGLAFNLLCYSGKEFDRPNPDTGKSAYYFTRSLNDPQGMINIDRRSTYCWSMNNFERGFAEPDDFIMSMREKRRMTIDGPFQFLNDSHAKAFLQRYAIRWHKPKFKFVKNNKTGNREEFDPHTHEPTTVYVFSTGLKNARGHEAELLVCKWEIIDEDNNQTKIIRKGWRYFVTGYGPGNITFKVPCFLYSIAETMLFNGHRLNGLRRVAICEGEKDCQTVEKLTDIIGVSPFRTNHIEPQHASQLKAIKTKLLFFDADLPGIAILEKTVDSLFAIDRRSDVRIVDCHFPIEASGGKDVSDLTSMLGNKMKSRVLDSLIQDAARISSIREFKNWRDERLQS